MKSSIFILKKTSDLPAQQLKLGEHSHIFAESGSVYSLVDAETGLYPEGVLLQQEGDDLLLMLDGDVLLVLNEYFNEEKDVSFDQVGHYFAASDSSEAQQPAEHAPSKPIWSAETDTLVSLDNPDAASKAPETVSADGAVDTSLPNELSSANGEVAGMDPARPAPDQAHDKGLGVEEGVVGKGGLESIGWGWYAGAIGLGVIGAAAGGGGSSSSSDSSSGSGVGAATNSISISAAAGTFFSTVQIDVYDTDGNLLVSEDHNYSDGDYVYTGTYSGPILVEISDINNDAADYTDETTGQAKSLGTTLRAMMNTEGSADAAVSVTPLTELATQLAGVTGKAITAENVGFNGQVAKLFGLDSITAKPALTTDNPDDPATADSYGKILAILSGSDSDKDVSAAETISTISASLKEVMEVGKDLQFNSEVAVILSNGLAEFNDKNPDNTMTLDVESGLSKLNVPVLVLGNDEAEKAVKVLNSDDAGSETKLKLNGLSASNEVVLTINGEEITGAVVEDGYLTIPSSIFTGTGNVDVVIKTDGQEFSVKVKVDTEAPVAPTVMITEDANDDSLISAAELDGQVNVTISLTDTGAVVGDTLTVNGESITLTAAHIIEGEVLTAVDAPAEGATVTVEASITDVAGNESETGTDSAKLDTTAAGAPGVTIIEDANDDGLISEAELDGQVNVTLSLTDTNAVEGDILTVNGTEIELTAAHITAGEVLTAVDVPAEGATLTVEATITDAAGNVSETGSDSAKLDTTATGAPGVTITDDGNSDGLISQAELGADNVQVSVAVNAADLAEGGSVTLTIINGDAESPVTLTKADLDESETYSYDASTGKITWTESVAEGANIDVSATQMDAAGNVSETGTDSAKLDTTAAGAPGVDITEDADNDGYINKDELSGDVNVTLFLTDTNAVEGDILTVNGTEIELTAAHITAGEVLTAVDAPAEGATLTVEATITDAAGNVSDKGTDSAKLDTTAAGAPGVTIKDDANDDGLISAAELDGQVNVTLSLTDTGAVEGDTLTVNGESITLTAAHIIEDEVLTAVDAPAEGATLTVEATITDAAGNVSERGTDSAIIDTSVSAPSLSFSTTPNDLISTTVTVSLAEDVASWQYSLDGGDSWQDGQGERFSLAPETTYNVGEIRVRQRDMAGNVSDSVSNESVLETDVAIDPPSFELASDTGQSNVDFITSSTTVNVSSLEGAEYWNYSVDGGGSWSDDQSVETTSFELEDGVYTIGTILVTQTDADGNESTYANNPTKITIDTNIDSPAFNITDTGAFNSDGVTNELNVDVDLAIDVASWQFSLNGGQTWQSGSGGSFTLSANESYEEGQIQVKQTDIAGNESLVVMNTNEITTDISLLSSPVFGLNDDTGENKTDGISKDATVLVEMSEDVYIWQYSLDSGSTWSGEQSPEVESFELNGNTIYQAGQIQVRQIDLAGNVSTSSNPNIITIDTTMLSEPTITLNDDTGFNDSDSITQDSTINVELAEDAVSWTFSTDAGETWSGSQDISVTSFELGENSYYGSSGIQVKQFDAAGNESDPTVLSYVQTDTEVETPILELTITGANGTHTSELEVSVGLVNDVSTWRYSLDGGSNWQEGNGTSFTLEDSSTYAAGDIKVEQTDMAGNISASAVVDQAVITNTSLPSIPQLNFSYSNDYYSYVTSDTTVTVTLDENVASWRYSKDAGFSWTEGVGDSFELETGQGVYYGVGDLLVEQTDPAGNVSSQGLNESYISIDTIAPKPTFELVEDTGANDADGITSNITVNFTYINEWLPDSWQYSLDGGETWSEPSANNSSNSFALESNTFYEVGEIQVRQTDLAGNVSLAYSNEIEITTDTLAPVAPSFALHNDTGDSDSDYITSDTTIDVTSIESGASWQYSLDGGETWIEGSGTSFEMGALQTYKIGQIQVRQIDVAGNISAVASNDVVFVSDSLPAPIVTLAEDSGVSDSDNVTNVMTVNVGLDANATSWQYSLDAGGNWLDGVGDSFELAENTTYETGQIQVKQFDVNSNESSIFSNDTQVITDIIAPSEDSIDVLEDGSAEIELGEYYRNVESYQVGDTGEVIQTWIYYPDYSNQATLNIQRVTEEGELSNLPYVIELGSSFEGYYINDVLTAGSDDSVIISWQGFEYNDEENEYEDSALFFQLFDSNWSPIGEVQQAESSTDWHNDSEIFALNGSNQFALTWVEESNDGVNAYLQLLNAKTGEQGQLLTFTDSVTPYVQSIGNSGQFLVVWNEVQNFKEASAITKTQTYNADGTPANAAFELNPDAGEYSEDIYPLGSEGAFVALMVNETEGTLSLQTVSATGQLADRVELGRYSNDGDFEIDISTVNTDNDFAITWAGLNDTDETTLYTQLFHADGTADGEALSLPMLFDGEEEYGIDFSLVSGTSDQGYFINAEQYFYGEQEEDTSEIAVYFIKDNEVTVIAQSEENDNWHSFGTELLNDEGDVLVYKEGQDLESYDSDSWFQIYNADGTAKTAQTFFADGIYNLDFTVVNDEGDFLVSWVSYGGYQDENYQWISQTTNHIQLYAADGSLITPTEINPGEELSVYTAEAGAVYIVNADEEVVSMTDIIELESDLWNSVETEGDVNVSVSSSDLGEGSYYLYVSDLAGNLTQHAKLVNIVPFDSEFSEPDVDLNADTGWSDEDDITNDTLVNVKLTDGAIRWEYSLDHGVTWTKGENDSFDLTDNTEFNLNDIQIRQYDEEDNVSEVASNSDGYLITDNQISVPEIEIVGTTVLVTLDDDWHVWDYSLDGGDTWLTSNTDSFQLEPDTTYEAGSIIVWQEDRAGNEGELEYNQTYTTPAPYQAPTFKLFEDTGISESDGITNEGSLDVTLADDAVAFEYSLDGGENWQFGSGAYVLLGDTEFATKDFVAYQYDADGNESELTLDYDDESVDFAIGFDVLEGTVRWKYSIDDGETFTEKNWADVDGHFIDLDYGEEYAIGDIQVRQINAEGEISLVAKNELVIIVDDNAPYDLTVSPSYTKLEGTDTSLGSFDLQSTKSETLGDSGLFNLSWVEQNYIEGESTTEAFVQVIDSDGNAVSEKIAIAPTTEDVRIPAIEMIALGNTGSFVVTWWEQNDDYTEKNYFYQVYDADGAVTSPVGMEGEYYEEFISSVNDNGNFVLSYYSDIGDEQHTKSALFDVNGDKITDLLDIEYSYSLAETLSVGSEGNFVVLQNNTLALFDEVGVAINSTTLSSWSPELLTLGTSGGYGALYTGDVYYESFGEYVNSIVIDRFDESGTSLEEVALVTLGDGGYADILSATASDNGGFAVSWSNNSQTYLQAFDADGASFSEAVVIVPASDLGTVNAWGVSIESIEYNSSYIVTGEYNVQNNETNYYSGTVYFARLMDSDGAMTTIFESDAYSNYKVAAVGDNGAFVVTWEESDEYGQDLMVQVHNADGTVSDVVTLEASQYSYDQNGFIIELDNGEFAVSWTGDVYYSQDNKTSNVYIQKFNADGTIVDKTIIDDTGEVSVESADDGIAYLVSSDLFNDTDSASFFDDYGQWEDVYYDSLMDKTDNSSQWNSVEVTGGEEAFISAEGLETGSYYVLMADTAGNVYLSDVGITVNQAVTFDLVNGESTDLDSQTFDADETYNIYINIGDGSTLTLNNGEQWSGAANLGEDDTIILITNSSVTGFSVDNEDITWASGSGDAILSNSGEFTIEDSPAVDLWDGNVTAMSNVMVQVTEPSDV
ncbi:hypothetical protein J9B83_09440 [Marinomonas sp. A79]|uniref:Uncharacterized protein n=1 Tax=Marinomonas vulgaris TaxID=2823372 RepID=A0ABS5HDY6_9GAMM|nr:hypothetical protein [Marinomonas vulgaris]MBR7889164.1 hypothetical protein [Marinomonas vulgaris]